MIFDEDGGPASAHGIMQCLRLLAEEAAMLNLQRTLCAIQDAMDTVADESDNDDAPTHRAAMGAGLTLH
jgi:hypothetical protein